ncbi:MAG: PhoH family protein [Candidatus Omnitrophota bacterium]
MEKRIQGISPQEIKALFGLHDRNLRAIEKEYKIKISLRPDDLRLSGAAANIAKASKAINYLLSQIRSGSGDLPPAQSRPLLSGRSDIRQNNLPVPRNNLEAQIFKAKHIGPRTKVQSEYVEAIKKYSIVFGLGPAGTGKTYLAMSSAVEALKKQEVRRIILTRPAIEAGESLGFLPGDMYEKISPYLRPLYDALYDMMEVERIEKYLETGIIEVAPLAYMRGRTLNDAFIILDEAQNCTPEQVKMFLTRLGFDSKAVITGDMTQSDLPGGSPTGLLAAQEILGDIEGIRLVYFSGADVVRHPLVQKIIEAYDNAARQK